MGTNNLLLKAVKDKSKIIFFQLVEFTQIKEIYGLVKNKKHLKKK